MAELYENVNYSNVDNIINIRVFNTIMYQNDDNGTNIIDINHSKKDLL